MYFNDFYVFFTLKIPAMIYRYHLLSIHPQQMCKRSVSIMSIFWIRKLRPNYLPPSLSRNSSQVPALYCMVFVVVFFLFFIIVLLGYKNTVKGMYPLLILSRKLVIFENN